MKTVDFIILNWKTETETLACLRAIHELNGDYHRNIIVVDNGSTSTSQKTLSDSGLASHVVINKENLGFSGGINSAQPYFEGEVIALVNSDCLLGKDWLEIGMKVLTDREVGLVGGREFLWNDANPAYNTANESTLLPLINPRDCSVEPALPNTHSRNDLVFITASNLLIRGELFSKLNGFDASFFLYLEDADFCARMINLGYKIAFASEMQAWHRINLSSSRMPYNQVYFSRRNRYIVIAEHFGSDWASRVFKIATHELLANARRWQPGNEPKAVMHRAATKAAAWALIHFPNLAWRRKRYHRQLAKKPIYYERLTQLYNQETRASK